MYFFSIITSASGKFNKKQIFVKEIQKAERKMTITEAKFAGSCTRVNQKPSRRLPEFAFIGRLNVGKSSLMKILRGNSKLAKTSSTPGKSETHQSFHHQ